MMPATGFWLTSERLALRRFTADDLDFLLQLFSDPRVTQHLGGTRDRAATEELLNNRILRYYEEQPGLGIWMTVERATGRRVGFHVLNHIQGESIVQVGFTLAPTAWGYGYATEMGAALLRYGFEDLGLQRIAGITNLDHTASQRVLLKIGLHRQGDRSFAHPAYASQNPMAWFERDATDWLEEHTSRLERR